MRWIIRRATEKKKRKRVGLLIRWSYRRGSERPDLGERAGLLLALLEEFEIPVSGHVRCPHVALDYVQLDFFVGRNYHGPVYAFLDVGLMITFLSIEDEAILQEDAFKASPMDRD